MSVPERWTAATVNSDNWVDPEDDPRDSGRSLVGERDTLLEYLNAYRLTLRMKCEGLSAEQLAMRSVPPSTMSLLGLIRHFGEVERVWTKVVMRGQDVPRLYSTEGQRDGDFHGAVADPDLVAEAYANWQAEMNATDELIAETDDLATMSTSTSKDPITLREVLVHLIEEYARHCGHADLLRECIDGRVGQ